VGVNTQSNPQQEQFPVDYPVELVADLVLETGTPVHVRPILASDARHIRHALETADTETLYRRFFTTRPQLDDDDIDRLAQVDYHHRLALVAFSDDEPVAIARYESNPDSTEAEVAFAVDPGFQGRGIASHLGRILIERAAQEGKQRIVAYYLATNEPAARLINGLGLKSDKPAHGVVEATLELSAIPG